MSYLLSIYQPDGDLLYHIPEWYSGQRWAQLNKPDVIQFNVPADFVGASNLVFPNEIWLRKQGSNTVLQKFTIVATTEGAAGHAWIQVEGQSLLGQLARERGCSYATTSATAVSSILSTLLSTYQNNTYPISVGTVESAYGSETIEITFEDNSLLDALRQIRAVVGGYFSVDTSRNLNWSETPGSDDDSWIRMAHNAKQIRKRIDHTELATRMVGYGYGVTPDTRLSSTQNDATAQSTYGVVAGSFYEPGIRDQDTLDAVTLIRLAQQSLPRISYHIEAIDLSETQSILDYSFTADLIEPGNVVRVLCDAPSLDISPMIRSVTWSLDYPEQVELTLVDPETGDDMSFEQDDVDRLTSVLERLERLSRDTGVLESVRKAISDDLDDLSKVLWFNHSSPYEGNLAEAIEDLFELADDADVAVDAMRDDVWNALQRDLNSGNYGTLVGQLQDALGSGGDPSDATPEPVDLTTGAAGTDTEFARADHVHVGQEHYQATSKAGLAAADDGATGYDTANDKYYVRLNGAWVCLTHAEA